MKHSEMVCLFLCDGEIHYRKGAAYGQGLRRCRIHSVCAECSGDNRGAEEQQERGRRDFANQGKELRCDSAALCGRYAFRGNQLRRKDQAA